MPRNPPIVADVPPQLRRQLVPIDDVRPLEGNPRRGDVDFIRGRLRDFGQFVPILVRVETSEILKGNHTWHACREEGWTHVAVLWRHEPDDARARALAIADNAASDRSEWDVQALAADLTSLPDPDLAGFDAADLDDVLQKARAAAAVEAGAAHVEDPEIGPAPARPTTRLGDVIVCGDHRIVCADSRDEAVVAEALAGDRIDFMFTSPPYNVDVDYATHNDSRAPWPEYRDFLLSVVQAWLPHVENGRAIGWNIGVYPSVAPHRQAVALESLGLEFIRQVIWRKSGVSLPKWHITQKKPVARRFSPNPVHEMIYLFSKGGALAHGAELDRVDELAAHDVFDLHQSQSTRDIPVVESNKRTGGDQAKTLRTRKRAAHPAPFPVRLPALFMAHMAAPGELVADPFGGAGSTMIAAEQLDRRAIICEIDPGYCDVAVERWEKLTGEKAIRPRRRRGGKGTK